MEVNESADPITRHRDPARFYRRRQRFSLSLLLFVVIVGLPIIGIPSLRNRLSMRVIELKAAISGDRKPAIVEVGANREPLPQEYQRPEPVLPRPPVLPQPERVFTMEEPVTKPGRPARVIVIERPANRPEEQIEQASSDIAGSQSEEPELKYQRGKEEQEAYDLLLQSYPAVAEMVQGKNPSLRFRSWDAVNRGEDTYWVRLKFQSEGNAEADYIWIVKPQANQVSPLNFNARGIS